MADFEYVSCPKCHDKFMAGEEFFRLPQAYCHCPTAAMNFRSASPPAKRSRRTNAPVDQRHDLARQSRNQKREKRNYRGGAEYAERSFYCKLSLCVLSASVVRIRTFAQAIQTFRHSN